MVILMMELMLNASNVHLDVQLVRIHLHVILVRIQILLRELEFYATLKKMDFSKIKKLTVEFVILNVQLVLDHLVLALLVVILQETL